MAVQALASIDPNQFFNLHSISHAGGYQLNTRVGSVAVSNDFSGRLAVTTAEGDRVTLAADVEANYRAGAYRSVDPAEGNVGASYAQYVLARNFGVTVNGDLNEEELQDLEKLFEKISNVFHGVFLGQDGDVRTHTTKLAEEFSGLSTLSTFDLSAAVVRSVEAVVASHITPGGAPGTVAAIPQPSNGTTAPTPSSDASDNAHVTVPVKNATLGSLIQQVLEALNEAKVESEKVRKYLPDFFEKLRDDLVKQLRGQREPNGADQDHSLPQVSDEVRQQTSSDSLIVAYRTVTETSISLSVQS